MVPAVGVEQRARREKELQIAKRPVRSNHVGRVEVLKLDRDWTKKRWLVDVFRYFCSPRRFKPKGGASGRSDAGVWPRVRKVESGQPIARSLRRKRGASLH